MTPVSTTNAAPSPETAEPLAGRTAVNTDGLWAGVWKQFKRNPIALISFYVVCFLFLVALFADFLANNKPYYLSYRDETYFPIFRSYLVRAGLGQWPKELLNVDFKKLEGAAAVFPPVPYLSTAMSWPE
jgi:peptide/nickel transport system permease protein